MIDKIYVLLSIFFSKRDIEVKINRDHITVIVFAFDQWFRNDYDIENSVDIHFIYEKNSFKLKFIDD